MRRPLRAVACAAALAAASGCVYYNGMYNARRAEREALRFDREGRTAEARDRWARAVIHADSVAARHPGSPWAEAALLLSGRASLQLEDYASAVVTLDRAARLARTPAQRAEALTLRGRANLGLGWYVVAHADLDSALGVPPRDRGEALLLRGLVQRQLGHVAAALADFAASGDPRAAPERARTLIGTGDTAAAIAQLDALVGARPFDESYWRSALDSLTAQGAAASANRLAGLLAARADLTRGTRARVLLDDGARRLAARDTAAARSRDEAAAATAPDSVEARIAAVRLACLAVPGASSDAELDSLSARLGAAVDLGGVPAREADRPSRLLDRTVALERDTTASDASWFLRAEILRDSLGAVPLSTRAFADMARRFPASPWTPKALLAAIAAGHPAADSLRALLDARYPASPYRRAALGLSEGTAAYATLEDSLARAIRSAPVGLRRGSQDRPRLPAGSQPAAGAPRSKSPGQTRPDTLEASS